MLGSCAPLFSGMLACLLMLAGGTGCASQPGLTLTSIDHKQTYSQTFTQAYTAKNENGDTDVVLIDQATQQSLEGQTSTAPVRQVMHIRIVWSPTRDMKAVASNAAVRWYVIGRSSPQDLLQYAGIAFVSCSSDDTTATLKIHNALLKPTGEHGSLIDPIGSSRVEGTFVARQNSEAVSKVLNSLKSAVAAANSASPSPPPHKIEFIER